MKLLFLTVSAMTLYALKSEVKCHVFFNSGQNFKPFNIQMDQSSSLKPCSHVELKLQQTSFYLILLSV